MASAAAAGFGGGGGPGTSGGDVSQEDLDKFMMVAASKQGALSLGRNRDQAVVRNMLSSRAGGDHPSVCSATSRPSYWREHGGLRPLRPQESVSQVEYGGGGGGNRRRHTSPDSGTGGSVRYHHHHRSRYDDEAEESYHRRGAAAAAAAAAPPSPSPARSAAGPPRPGPASYPISPPSSGGRRSVPPLPPYAKRMDWGTPSPSVERWGGAAATASGGRKPESPAPNPRFESLMQMEIQKLAAGPSSLPRPPSSRASTPREARAAQPPPPPPPSLPRRSRSRESSRQRYDEGERRSQKRRRRRHEEDDSSEDERHERRELIMELEHHRVPFEESAPTWRLRHLLERKQMNNQLASKVAFMKNGLKVGSGVLEWIAKRFCPRLGLEGWSDTLKQLVDSGDYDALLEQTYRKIWHHKNQPDPWLFFGLLVVGTALLHILDKHISADGSAKARVQSYISGLASMAGMFGGGASKAAPMTAAATVAASAAAAAAGQQPQQQPQQAAAAASNAPPSRIPAPRG